MSAISGQSARVIDGVAAAREIYSGLKERVAVLGKGGIRPGLAAVRVGEDPASRIYVRNKVRACEEVGVLSQEVPLPADCAAGAVIAAIEKLNRDASVHGILLQLPLPAHLDAGLIMQAIAPAKDVDGMTRPSLGALLAGQPTFDPCTPAGVMALLERAGVAIEGRLAVIVGRSTIVGKPMALMLLGRNATVTLCHSRTRDLRAETIRGDILVSAVGQPRLVTAGMVKPGAAVIDVGINRLADGKLAGDVDFASVGKVAGWITPVPGGVGPMTVAMLISNTIVATERAARLLTPQRAGQQL